MPLVSIIFSSYCGVRMFETKSSGSSNQYKEILTSHIRTGLCTNKKKIPLIGFFLIQRLESINKFK